MALRQRKNDILARFSLIFLITIFASYFNLIFEKPTIYSSYFLIKLFYSASLAENIISFNNVQIELISACIAGLAYLLLIVLNLASEMPLKTRIKALLGGILAFFVFNVIRISGLALLFSSKSLLFSYLHIFFWYFGSILAVFLIWFFSIRLLKIKSYPFISDIKWILENKK